MQVIGLLVLVIFEEVVSFGFMWLKLSNTIQYNTIPIWNKEIIEIGCKLK